MKKLLKNKSLFFLSLAILILVIGGTFAYFSNYIFGGMSYEQQKINVVLYNLVMDDDNDNSENFMDYYYAFYNDGDLPVFLRFNFSETWYENICVKYSEVSHVGGIKFDKITGTVTGGSLVKTAENEENKRICLNSNTNVVSNTYEGKNIIVKKWDDDFNDNFVQGPDGWYYYKKIFYPNEEVYTLDYLNFNEELSSLIELYSSYTYDFNIYFEAVQAADTSAKKVWDLEPTISDEGIIDWNF